MSSLQRPRHLICLSLSRALVKNLSLSLALEQVGTRLWGRAVYGKCEIPKNCCTDALCEIGSYGKKQ